MRVVLISDTHVTFPPVELAKDLRIDLDHCDQVLHCGDFDSWETYQWFKERYPILAVCGNKDSFSPCEEIPTKRVVTLGGFRIGMMHGWGPPVGVAQRIRARWDESVDLIAFGHSHHSADVLINGIQMINPGTPTDMVFAHHQTYAILDLEDTIKVQFKQVDR